MPNRDKLRDRPYKSMNYTIAQGLIKVENATLKTLGAVEPRRS